MSKKKDRMDTNFRNCPICGGKQIIVYSNIKKFIFKKNTYTYIYCYRCHKDINVKIAYRKENLDYIEMKNLLERSR